MKHISALIVKFIMTVAVLEITLLLFSSLSFTNILWISLVITIVGYILGDMLILPASNNLVATIADIGLAFASIYLFNFVWKTTAIPFINALVIAAVLGLGEWFFHKIINREVNDDNDII